MLAIWENIKAAFTAAWEAIKTAWSAAQPFFQAIWEGIKTVFSVVASVLGGYFSAAWSVIKVVWDTVVGFFSNIWDGIKTVFSVVKSVLSGDFEAAKNAVQNAWDGITSFFSDIWSSIQDVFSDAWEKFKNIGSNIVSGIKEGMSKAWKKLTDWVSDKFNGLIGFAERIFKINSPSRVFRDKIGLMIVRGMALGIEKGADEVLKAAETINQKLIDKEEALVRKLEDTGLDEATKTALTNQLNIVKEFRSEYESALDDIQKSQESMADKLQDYGDLFTTVKDETGSFLELGDLQADIAAIERYGDALENLKARGVSESLLNEITSLNVDEATAYTEQLLAMTEEEYSSYIALWEKKQAEAQKIAAQFYADELDALQVEFVDKIPQELSDVKAEMQNIGANSIQGMIEGMYAKSGALWSAAKNIISQAINAMRTEADIHSPSRKTAELVGAPMGEGVAVGFFNGIRKSRAAIEAAVMDPIARFNPDDMYKAAAATVNGMAMAGGTWTQTVVIPINLNGKQIAEIVFDPLRNISKQRGVALS